MGLPLPSDIGVESKSTLVIWRFLHTQHVVKCGLPFMTLLHIFLQRSGDPRYMTLAESSKLMISGISARFRGL